VQEISLGAFSNELSELKDLPLADLKARYNARVIET
jgi:hypothetical protein